MHAALSAGLGLAGLAIGVPCVPGVTDNLVIGAIVGRQLGRPPSRRLMTKRACAGDSKGAAPPMRAPERALLVCFTHHSGWRLNITRGSRLGQ